MNLETNQLAQCDPHSQHKLPKQNLFQFGHLEYLSEMCKLEEHLYNPFVEFQTWFLKYHQACLLTKWTYNKTSDKPYCYVEHLGVFTDLNLLAKRIKNELQTHLRNKFDLQIEELKKWKPSADFFQESLIVSLPDYQEKEDVPVYWKELQVSYIQLNNTDERYGYEGWKFDIK